MVKSDSVRDVMLFFRDRTSNASPLFDRWLAPLIRGQKMQSAEPRSNLMGSRAKDAHGTTGI